METLIEIPQLKELQKVIINPNILRKENANLSIQKMELDPFITKIDFIIRAPHYYANGGWIQMDANCFIRPCGGDSRLSLLKAVNIPIAPQKHFFKRCGELLQYTLYFPGLPEGTQSIDIIERDAPNGTWFNFYGVSVNKIRTEALYVDNTK